MACCPIREKIYGYEDSRFEKDVDENFHCSICYNVLKEPRMCRNNEHIFCLDCIAEHLRVNSQACPECNEHLSVDTLRRARLASKILSKLKINCDHASRGCPELTCLENLETHVANCGFAPVLCSNAECGMVINKQERVHHETAVCEYRKVKCHDCGQIQEDVGTLRECFMELDGNVEATNKEMKEMKNNQVEMKKIVGTLEGRLMQLDGKVVATNKEMKNNQIEMKKIVGTLEGHLMQLDGKVVATSKEMKNNQIEMKKIVGTLEGRLMQLDRKVENSQDQIKQQVKKEVDDVNKEVKNVKESLLKMNKDVDDVKVMMMQMLEKFSMLAKLPSLTEGVLNAPREDILVAGGYGAVKKTSKSTEIYSWEKNGWFEVSQMNEEHARASSCIYNDQVFVVGGVDCKAIETLNLNKLPLKWIKCRRELPYNTDDHQTIVYEQHIIHIGGYIRAQVHRRSDMISELQLTSPCTMKKLCQMPEPRDCHVAEIFEDKVVILGGEDTNGEVLNNVLEFDAKKNECEKMPPLPHPLTKMATVCWRDQVVVLGGRDKDDEVKNDVFMYDCKTGKTTTLPSMLERRYGCCAIITGNTIVVIGGRNEKNATLNSVECLTMEGYTWKYLPAMSKARYAAVAEVLPSTRKYV